MSKTKARIIIEVDEDICKGCGLCIAVCPQGALALADHMNSRGFHPAVLRDADRCTGCANCALMCPDVCLRIVRER